MCTFTRCTLVTRVMRRRGSTGMTYEYGFADGRHGLAGGRGGELDGQVGQTEDVHQRLQALLADELAAVVVRRVVA